MNLPPPERLFREEAVEHQRRRLWGNVVISQPVGFAVITAVLTVATVLVGVFVYAGTYARRETVTGYLVPSRGLVTVQAQRGGTVTELHVEEGQRVRAGALLVTLRADGAMADGSSATAQLGTDLDAQRAELARQIGLQDRQLASGRAQLAARIGALDVQAEQARVNIDVQQQRAELAQQQVEVLKPVVERGFASRREMQARQQEALAMRNAVAVARQQLADVQRQMAEARVEFARLPVDHAERVWGLKAQMSGLSQRRTEVAQAGGYALVAPMDGVVTGLQAVRGQTVNPASPLVSMRGDGDALVAHLLVPTRAAGFIHRG